MSESRVIWKFGLPIKDVVALQVPRFARPLHVGEQWGVLCLWMEVNPDAPLVRRVFTIVGTGRPLTNDLGWYIGTVSMPNGLVWHVYDEQNLAAER